MNSIVFFERWRLVPTLLVPFVKVFNVVFTLPRETNHTWDARRKEVSGLLPRRLTPC